MSKILRFMAFPLIGLACIGVAAPEAAAYEWKTSDLGEPLRWFRPELTFSVSTVEPEDLRWEDLKGMTEAAFTAWTDIPGCRVPQVDYLGPSTARSITSPTSITDEPDNLIVIIDSQSEWRSLPGATNTQIALTFIAHNSETGEIIDADIAINDAAFDFTIEDAAVGGVDLLSAITHEVGHFFGMEHSTDPESTMLADYGSQPDKRLEARTLAQDDIDGVCALYQDVPEWKPPGTGGDADCSATGTCDDNGGCSSGGASPGLLASLLFIGLVAIRRRRTPLHREG